ncbi:hypothetical protein NPS70_12505 [Streptomyces sp. C10-9-1]|uniref:hypothetical protein n=1 Tax=Streptomyces sp. C10-9-1 TaxID=1859285 RepID=UPI002112A238|nr:hypothetical protein [Streptomyces sp. C10-9-1]MCQ6554013.1 hypothetical protein [Streptomyces sp. C10-9-1]
MEPQAPPPTGSSGAPPDELSRVPGTAPEPAPGAAPGAHTPDGADAAPPAEGRREPDGEQASPAQPAPDTAPAPPEAPEPAADTPEPDAAGTPGPRPRRKRRAVAVLAAALVLGVVGGTAVGYAVQADRAPTPLPPLAQQGLTHPAEPLPGGETIEPLPEEEDHGARTSGDLRKLLLPVPKGARASEAAALPDGWVRLDQFAAQFEFPDFAFEKFARTGFRRAVTRAWEKGDRLVVVNLVQFRRGGATGARVYVEEQLDYLDEDRTGRVGKPVPGSGNGRFVIEKGTPYEGGPQGSLAQALAYRGDVAMEIYVFDRAPITEKDIRTLAERQLGRL